MTAASTAITGNANRGTEQVFGKSDPGVRFVSAVMQKLRAKYPEKTAANIAARAKVSTRTAEYWLTDKRDMTAESFIRLLASDDGADVLEAVMMALPKRERPRWWERHANTARMAEIERRQAEHDEEIRQLRLSLLK
jgi:hypothetical protein